MNYSGEPWAINNEVYVVTRKTTDNDLTMLLLVGVFSSWVDAVITTRDGGTIYGPIKVNQSYDASMPIRVAKWELSHSVVGSLDP